MKFYTIWKDSRMMSKVATIIIFMALIRCITEPLRLQYYAPSALTFAEIKPFLLGALAAAIALLVMTILFYYCKYRLVIATSVLTIIVLLIIKQAYLSF